MTIVELMNDFDKNYIERKLKPNTIAGYRVNIKNHIIPLLGTFKIDFVDYEILDIFIDRLQKSLSNTSIIYVLATLRKAYSYAVKRGYCRINPVVMVEKPRKHRMKYNTLNEDEATRLLSESFRVDSSLYFHIMLALKYGLRRGETIGIDDNSLNHNENSILIYRTVNRLHGVDVSSDCKNCSSNRSVLLSPSDFDFVSDFLQVFKPLSSSALDKRFSRFLEVYGFNKMRFHDLRHTYATLMLKHRVPVKIVSSVLGHSSVKVTLDTYSHCLVEFQEMCIDALDQIYKKR